MGPSRSFIHIGPPVITVVLGMLIQLVGWKFQSSLLMYFPLLGYLTARSQLQYWLTAPTEKMHWWYAHMSGMFVACIATVTAFLVTALPRIWPSPLFDSPLLWIAPGLVLGMVLNRWTVLYRTQFEKVTAQ